MTTQPTFVPPADQQRQRGLSEWWYLIFLATLVFQPVLAPGTTAATWLITGALGLAAGGLYVVTVLRAPRNQVAAAIAFTVLGVVGVWFNGGAAVFFVYAAAVAGTFRPRARARRWLIGLTAVMVVLIVVSPIPWPFRAAAYAFPLAFIWIVGNQVIEAADRARESKQLRIDNVRVERLATLGERERIARDMHDLLGHTLTGIVVRAQLVERLARSDPEQAAAQANEIEDLAREALAEVRATVSGWRHHALDAEIDAARQALTAAGVALVVHQETAVSLSPTVEAALALAVREAVTNVVRHAAARTCDIGIADVDGDVQLTVTDDGVGATRPDGSGLLGMRERIAMLGGRVERAARQAEPGQRPSGTTLVVTVPAQQVV